MDKRKREQICDLVRVVGMLLISVVILGPIIGSIVGISDDTKQTALILLAKSASAIEAGMGVLGVALLIMALINYPDRQDLLRERVDLLKNSIETWFEQYEWFHHYLQSAKTYMNRAAKLTFDASQSEMEARWTEVKNETAGYNCMLKEAYDRIAPIDDGLQRLIPLLQRRIEDQYEVTAAFSIIMASIGMALVVAAVALPGTDSMLGFVASQMVDPSLIGEDRIEQALRIKEALKSL